MPNFYEILGLTAGAAPEQVKAAFHALAKGSHPDVNASDATAAKRFKEINEAYEILGDPEKRAVYDLGLRQERADTRWRFWNTMVVTTASFTIMLGGGLYSYCIMANAPSHTPAKRRTLLPIPANPCRNQRETTYLNLPRGRLKQAQQN